ncbi:hypothetical protein TSA6c_00330 [Azospirillum sp. TSA6c]|uniref:hypothetical protein n=1 Tax=Azospirillum sp. TSA6c TaxID=709813 RepID=UPI000D619F93|nr:hypothetical protein [Azospirillum sp. TSA6c]PWC54408.1 hypothetical protein TSA6c_00330 [Azospirillum sp. TSA6c]
MTDKTATITPAMCVAASDAAMERGVILPASHAGDIIEAALRAAPSPAPAAPSAAQWMPIVDAPRDGRTVDLWGIYASEMGKPLAKERRIPDCSYRQVHVGADFWPDWVDSQGRNVHATYFRLPPPPPSAAPGAQPVGEVVDRLPPGHIVLEQADMLDGRVSQTVKRPDGNEYQRIVSPDEAYGPDDDEGAALRSGEVR